MKQIRGVILDLNSNTQGEVLQELCRLLEDNWVIVNQAMTHDHVVYLLAKVPDELIKKLEGRQTLHNVLH